jgi:hypothetical protein
MKLSTNAFWIGLPGWMMRNRTPSAPTSPDVGWQRVDAGVRHEQQSRSRR